MGVLTCIMAASESLGMFPSLRAEVRDSILRSCSLDMWKVFSVLDIFGCGEETVRRITVGAYSSCN